LFRKKNRCYYCKVPEGTPPVRPEIIAPKSDTIHNPKE
jgi:rhomboid family protein